MPQNAQMFVFIVRVNANIRGSAHVNRARHEDFKPGPHTLENKALHRSYTNTQGERIQVCAWRVCNAPIACVHPTLQGVHAQVCMHTRILTRTGVRIRSCASTGVLQEPHPPSQNPTISLRNQRILEWN